MYNMKFEVTETFKSSVDCFLVAAVLFIQLSYYRPI